MSRLAALFAGIRRFWDRVSGKEAEGYRHSLSRMEDRLFRIRCEQVETATRVLPHVRLSNDFRRILADYNRSVLEAKSPAARGKLAAPAFYAILEAARLHGIQPLGTESLNEQ